jgi:radical SAM-linked protein
MMRLWYRALRRSGLPLRMSEGFHVRPRVSFAMARGVGIASQAEWLEFELADWVNPDVAIRRLAHQLPPGIAVREARAIAPSDRAVVRRIRYEVTLGQMPDDIEERIDRLLQRDDIVVERGSPKKRRTVDIRPLIVELSCRDNVLDLAAECRQSGSLRPEEVLAELGLSPDAVARSHIARIDAQLAADKA